ncbi:MAG: hypothetical protein WCJ39_07335 [bacterium]
MGEYSIKDSYGNKVQVGDDIKALITTKFASILSQADLSSKKQDNAVVKFVKGI